MEQNTRDITEVIADFLNTIGIPVIWADLSDETFLPGIRVDGGALYVDRSKLKYPGDLLHEGGHLAVMPASLRPHAEDDNVDADKPGQITEVEAMAWSYAAALHLGIDPRVVFHAGGYHGRSEGLLLSFTMGAYIGVGGLQTAGMTANGPLATELGVPPFPHMIRWLRD